MNTRRGSKERSSIEKILTLMQINLSPGDVVLVQLSLTQLCRMFKLV